MNVHTNIVVIPREFYDELHLPYPRSPGRLEIHPDVGCCLIKATLPGMGIETCVAVISHLAARALAAEIAIFAAANGLEQRLVWED